MNPVAMNSSVRQPGATTPAMAPEALPRFSQSLSTLGNNASPKDVGDGFESMFLSLMLEPLQESEAFFGSGPAGRTFSGLFTQQLADRMAATRPLGVGDQIEQSLLRAQQAVQSYRKDSQ